MSVLTMAVRSLARRKTRTLIVIAALTLALTLITILPPSINARQELTQQTLEGLNSTANVLKETVTLSATEIECGYPTTPEFITYEENGQIIPDLIMKQQLMNESLISKIASLTDVVDVIPLIVDYPTEKTKDRPYEIHGIAIDDAAFQKDPSLLPTNITKGRNLQLGDRGVIVIDEIVAKNATFFDDAPERSGYTDVSKYFEAVVAKWNAKEYIYNVGDSFEILGRKFTIVGIEGSGFNRSSRGVTMSLVDAQVVLGKVGQVSSCRVFVSDVDNVNSVVSRVRGLDSGLVVSSGYTQLNAVQPLQDQVDVLVRVAENNLSHIQRVGMAELGVGVVVAVVVVLFMMLYSVRERTREIGTLKAMGASTGRVLGQFMLEGVLLCVVAAVLAIAISVFVLPQLSSLILPAPVLEGVAVSTDANGTMGLSTVVSGAKDLFMSGKRYGSFDAQTLSWSVESYYLNVGWVVLSFGSAVLLGALGSLYPALKAARTKPAEAMRYE